MRPRAWGLSARLTASYVLVTLAVVVLVEAIVLGYQAPRLVSDTRLQTQVEATNKFFSAKLSEQYPQGLPRGTLLGEPTSAKPGPDVGTTDGATLLVPALAGPIKGDQPVTAVVALAGDGTIFASSAPARYPTGGSAQSLLPAGVAAAITGGGGSFRATSAVSSTRYGDVQWTLAPSPYRGGVRKAAAASQRGAGTSRRARTPDVAYVYVQAPVSSSGFVNPITAWRQLRQQAAAGPLLTAAYVLLIVIIPVGMGFGLLASRRLVRRVRRLERATVAVADGDYAVDLPTSGHDEVGRLEANFTAMTRQLRSAMAAERERAGGDARAAERSRIAREIHDAISQHLFGLRMIAGGLRRAQPDSEQVRAVERITDEALRDMRALLFELRPAGLDGGGLAGALEELCTAYRDRLEVAVDAAIEPVYVSEPVEHALLRVAQEACTNAVRHGEAARIAVSLARVDGHLELGVHDDGRGFDPDRCNGGSGLAHIRERVGEIGGTVAIRSRPGAGTTLTVRVPVP